MGQSRYQDLTSVFPHRPVNHVEAVIDLHGVMVPQALPDRIQAHGFAAEKLLNLAESLTALEAARARQVIDGIGGVKAFVIEEGGDQCRKAGAATDATISCHQT